MNDKLLYGLNKEEIELIQNFINSKFKTEVNQYQKVKKINGENVVWDITEIKKGNISLLKVMFDYEKEFYISNNTTNYLIDIKLYEEIKETIMKEIHKEILINLLDITESEILSLYSLKNKMDKFNIGPFTEIKDEINERVDETMDIILNDKIIPHIKDEGIKEYLEEEHETQLYNFKTVFNIDSIDNLNNSIAIKDIYIKVEEELKSKEKRGK